MSINNAKNSLKTIVMDDKTRKEFLNLKNDEIFEFCKKNSKGKFNLEEFRQAVKDILMAYFPEEYGATALDESLEKVAGGTNRLATKLAAFTLALTSVGGGLFVNNDTLFSAPSANALFRTRKKYIVPNPWDVDEVIEAVRNESYFYDDTGYNEMLEGLDKDLENAQAAYKKFVETKKNQSTRPSGGDSVTQLLNQNASNLVEGRGAALLQYNIREAKERQKLAAGRRFVPFKHVDGLKNHLNNKEEFKEAWKAGDTGKKWWEQNISKNTYYVPCSPNGGFFGAFTNGIGGNDNKNVVPSDEDLSVITNLQTAYWKSILKSNGFSDSNISLSYVEPLLKSKEFCETVNRCFGKYEKQLSTGTSTTFSDAPATSQIYGIAQAYAKDVANTEGAIAKDKMKRYAPLISVASLAFLSSSTLQNVTSLFKQAYGAARTAALRAYNRIVYNRLTLERDPVKLRELIREYLKANIMCQDRAIDKIVEIISGMADFWSESDRTGNGGDSACTMVFMGDSGIGKTLAARCLSQALFHKDMQPWQFVTSTAVTGSKTSQPPSDTSPAKTEVLSPADQLFNVNSEMVRQLRLNNRVVIVLDEVDKIHKFDPDDTIVERLRDARDTGKLLIRDGVNYFYIDVSRTVFILITNERRECWGLPAVELTPEQAASRTYVERDRSLVNRFDIVEFDYFTSEGYQTVLRPKLEELADEYSENYNINIRITDELVKSIGDAAERKNKGVRGVNDYLIALRGKLVDYRSKHKVSPTEANSDTKFDISVVYDQDTNSFELIDVQAPSTNEKDAGIFDVPSVPDQNINLPELIDAKESLTNEKAADASGTSDQGVNSPELIDAQVPSTTEKDFDYFTSEGYQTVLRPKLEELADEYSENYNINIRITDELVKSIGDAAERKNKGVRGVYDYLIALRGKLVGYRFKHKVSPTEANSDTKFDISVVYDQDTNSFELIDVQAPSTNEQDSGIFDVPSVLDQNINLPELIDAKESLINEKADDASGIPEHGINLSRLIDEPTREIGR